MYICTVTSGSRPINRKKLINPFEGGAATPNSYGFFYCQTIMELYKYEFIKELSAKELKHLQKEIGLEFNARKTSVSNNKINEQSTIIAGEIWVSLKNYDGYEVSNMGRVRSIGRIVYDKLGRSHPVAEVILKAEKTRFGYDRVGLCKNNTIKRIKVHQLVAMGFLDHNPCGYDAVVNHKNFIRHDNRLENLEVLSQRENSNRKHIKSTSKFTGVCWAASKEKWLASIRVNKKRLHLGLFDNEQEASEYYELAVVAINSGEPIRVKRIHNKMHDSLNIIID